MATVKWSLLARHDIREIADYIAKDSPYYSQRMVEKIFQRVQVLEDFPMMGRVVPEFSSENIRELIEGSYRLVYLAGKTEVVILRIHHSARLLKNFPSK